MGNQKDKEHVFERAGLGKAPFFFVGVTESKFQAIPGGPIKAGSSCDYCGTAIMICCQIRSSDGNLFKVGCDCVLKAGDAGLRRKVEQAKRDRNRQLREAREKRYRAEFKQFLIDYGQALSELPHPFIWHAESGKTLLDYLEYCGTNCSNPRKYQKQAQSALGLES